MAKNKNAFLIAGTLYKLTPENTLCEWVTDGTKGNTLNWNFETLPTYNRIYIPGSVFILDSVVGNNHSPRIIDETEARKLMDEHPAGINLDAYRRKFGDPPEVE